METTQMHRENAEMPADDAGLPTSDEELICGNCGFWAMNNEAYAYHTKLCLIPA